MVLETKYAAGQKHPRLVIADQPQTLAQYEEGAQAMNAQQIVEFQEMLDIYFDLLTLVIEMINTKPCILLHQLNIFQLVH